MKLCLKTLSILVLVQSSSVFAASFTPMKKGEWKREVIETSMGPAAQALMKPETFCVDESDTKDWEKRMKAEVAKSKLDCDYKELEQSSSKIAYHVKCKGTAASAAKSFPIGSSVEGDYSFVKENDNTYMMEQDSKATGLGIPEDALAKIPAAQRAAVAAALTAQKGAIALKSKHKYSFVKDACEKGNKAK